MAPSRHLVTHLGPGVPRAPAQVWGGGVRWTALGELPTPVDRAAALDPSGGACRVWIKRDDLSDARYGGSKVRKLEWVLPSAPFGWRAPAGRGAQHDDPGAPLDAVPPIASVGALGSHHLLALAVFAPTRGHRLHMLMVDQVPTAHARRNLAVIASSGARIWHVHRRLGLGLAVARYRRDVPPDARGIWMPAGASSGVGCFGYVEAGLELGAQIAAGLVPRPDAIYITAGSAGAGAGLLLGLGLAEVSTRVHLVSAVERIYFNAPLLALKIDEGWRALATAGLARARAQRWRAVLRRAGVSWHIDHRFVGGGFGVPTAAGATAIERARGAVGLKLEPTYTAKCLAALLDDAAHGRVEGDALWWNTHGANDLGDRIAPGWAERLPPSLREVVFGTVADVEDVRG